MLVKFGLHAAVNQGIAHPTMTRMGTNPDIIPGMTVATDRPSGEKAADRTACLCFSVVLGVVLGVVLWGSARGRAWDRPLVLTRPADHGRIC